MYGWVAPWNLLWLLAPAALLAWAFLPAWGQVATAPALFLWRDALARRSVWRRLGPWVQVGLAAAALVAFALALAEPYWTPTAGRRLLLIVDPSASMNARDGDVAKATRLDAARRQALAWIDSIGPDDRAAVVAIAGAPSMRQGWTNDREALRAAVTTVPATDIEPLPLETARAIRRCVAAVADSPTDVLLFTDADGAPSGTAHNAGLTPVRFGSTASDAILQLAHRRDPASKATRGVVVVKTLRERECVVQFGGGERLRETLPAGTHVRTFSLGAEPRGLLIARLPPNEGDPLVSDDAAAVWVEPSDAPVFAASTRDFVRLPGAELKTPTGQPLDTSGNERAIRRLDTAGLWTCGGAAVPVSVLPLASKDEASAGAASTEPPPPRVAYWPALALVGLALAAGAAAATWAPTASGEPR